MEGFKGLFSQTVEVVGRCVPESVADLQAGRSGEDILALLRRRPCTLEGISSGLALQPAEALKQLDVLCREGAVTAVHSHDGTFYKTKVQ